MNQVSSESGLSIAYGSPLSEISGPEISGPEISGYEASGIGALTLGGYLQAICERYSDSEAAVMRQGEAVERWTYNDLWKHSLEVAQALLDCGIGKGTRVGILMTNRLEFLSCLFGTAMAGGVATTISTFFTATELDEVLQAADCSVLLFERQVLKKDFAAMLTELEPKLATTAAGELRSQRFPFLRHLALVDSDDNYGAIEGWQSFRKRSQRISHELVSATASSVAPSDPGVLFFSSGSTGKAKGILSAHRAVCIQLWSWKIWYNIQQPPRTWSANGFFFSGNFSMALGGTLSSGGALILQRYFNAEEALRLAEQEGATMLLAWPHQWSQLQAAPNYLSTDLSALHYIGVESPLAQHPTVTTQWPEPLQAYGCTETFTLISVFPSGTPPEQAKNSYGTPTAGSVIKIVDPLTGHTMPIGERGEIAVKGPALMLGYLGTPLDETLDDDGFFRTNDGGYLDNEGRLFWEGRLNDIIKTGGANVSPLEIDAVIRDCPGVKVTQTIGVADELLGELVITCIVMHQGKTLSEEDIRQFAKQKLASFKVPRRVLFFDEADLKTTGSSKIKTADLRKLAATRLEILAAS